MQRIFLAHRKMQDQDSFDDACGSGLSFCVRTLGNCSNKGASWLRRLESMGIAGRQERTELTTLWTLACSDSCGRRDSVSLKGDMAFLGVMSRPACSAHYLRVLFFLCAAQALLAKDGDVVCSFSGPLLVQQLVHKTAASLLNYKLL